jgi:hypothetical protein
VSVIEIKGGSKGPPFHIDRDGSTRHVQDA